MYFFTYWFVFCVLFSVFLQLTKVYNLVVLILPLLLIQWSNALETVVPLFNCCYLLLLTVICSTIHLALFLVCMSSFFCPFLC